eukprot:360887-Chlamydomonas_euryale.AAC.2
MHWHAGPRMVVYDNSCNLSRYCLRRQPSFFAKTRFTIDRMHMRGHVACHSGYSMAAVPLDEVLVTAADIGGSHFQVITPANFNTQVAEQCNAKLNKIRTQLAYMRQEQYMKFARYYLYQHNRLIISRLPATCTADMGGTDGWLGNDSGMRSSRGGLSGPSGGGGVGLSATAVPTGVEEGESSDDVGVGDGGNGSTGGNGGGNGSGGGSLNAGGRTFAGPSGDIRKRRHAGNGGRDRRLDDLLIASASESVHETDSEAEEAARVAHDMNKRMRMHSTG